MERESTLFVFARSPPAVLRGDDMMFDWRYLGTHLYSAGDCYAEPAPDSDPGLTMT